MGLGSLGAGARSRAFPWEGHDIPRGRLQRNRLVCATPRIMTWLLDWDSLE